MEQGNKSIFFISDTHFYHKNIINYCNRPFDNVEEMNHIMIKNWNNTIKNNDKVFHLGDFGLYDKDNLRKIIQKLNGRISLIRGNHDRQSNNFYIDCGFDAVYKYPILYDGFFILSHAPIHLNPQSLFANIHGHIHNNHEIFCGIDDKNLYYNVSVEVQNYTPVNFEEIKRYYD